MKPNELIKILDSGVVHNLRISYCGGRIDVNPKHAPFELPDYEIVKLWADDRGYICVLLADGIAAENEKRSIVEIIKCPFCLSEIYRNKPVKFCPFCGQNIRDKSRGDSGRC